MGDSEGDRMPVLKHSSGDPRYDVHARLEAAEDARDKFEEALRELGSEHDRVKTEWAIEVQGLEVEVERLRGSGDEDLAVIEGLRNEVGRLREDRERLAHFIENITDQGFEVMRAEDGRWFVVT